MTLFNLPQKKVSIPGTVSRALKYIPELQKEVEKLKHKKKKLSSYSSSKVHLSQEVVKMQKSSLVSSVSVLGATEAVIQLISSNDHMSKRKEIVFLSKVLEYLEQEEDGLVLLNATNFKCSGEEMALCTLHIQVHIWSSVKQTSNKAFNSLQFILNIWLFFS